MSDGKLRQAIALEAARLTYQRVEIEYFTAKRKAAKRICRGSLESADLPSNAEIRDQVQLFARLDEGDRRNATFATAETHAPGRQLVAPASQIPAVPSLQTDVVDGLDDLGSHLEAADVNDQFFDRHAVVSLVATRLTMARR